MNKSLRERYLCSTGPPGAALRSASGVETPPPADEDLGERRYARAIYLMRKNELHVSRRAMVTKYPMCSRLITI
jgi:hypothetical protein